MFVPKEQYKLSFLKIKGQQFKTQHKDVIKSNSSYIMTTKDDIS